MTEKKPVQTKAHPSTREIPGYDIFIVGLGILSYLQVTREVEQTLRLSKQVFFLHPETSLVERFLNTLCPSVVNLYSSYEEDAPRTKAYESMINTVLRAAKDSPPVCLALYGHPVVFVTPTEVICRVAPEMGLSVKVLPGISALDCILVDLGLDPSHGLLTYEANDLLLRRQVLLPELACILWQPGCVESELFSKAVSKPERFLRLKRYLLEFYPPDHVATIISCSMSPMMESKQTSVALGDLESEHVRLHAGATLYIPPVTTRDIVDHELRDLIVSRKHLESVTAPPANPA